jgi:hypothetical protein
MASCNEFSVTNLGDTGHAAFSVWVQVSLSRTFDAILHEPLPQALLAIVDKGTESNAALKPVHGELIHIEA